MRSCSPMDTFFGCWAPAGWRCHRPPGPGLRWPPGRCQGWASSARPTWCRNGTGPDGWRSPSTAWCAGALPLEHERMSMQLGMVGLGRMGANIVRRLMSAGHDCVVFDVNPDAVKELSGQGATGAGSMAEFVAALTPPRAVWVMVPAGDITERTVSEL